MPFSKIAWFAAVRRDKRIPHAMRLVIEEIGDTANLAGCGAWKSTTTGGDPNRAPGLVELLGVSDKTVKRARALATELGYWTVSKPAPRGAGNYKSTEYRLLMPASK